MRSRLHRPLQLPARRKNIPPPRPPQIHRNPLRRQRPPKRTPPLPPSASHTQSPAPDSTQSDSPSPAVPSAAPAAPPPRVFRPVRHSAQQHILKRDPLPRPQPHLPHRIHHRLNRPLAIDRHHLAANRIVRRVQADRQLRPHLRRLLGANAQSPAQSPKSTPSCAAG